MSRIDAQRIAEIKAIQGELSFEIEQILDKYLGEGVGQWHSIGEWECEKSPVGVCVYRYSDDPCHDNCIYCYEPHERK